MLTLPALDPCDFLLESGAGAFRDLAERAVEPLAYADRPGRGAVRSRLRSRARGGPPNGCLGILNAAPQRTRLAAWSSSRPRFSTSCSRRLRVPMESHDCTLAPAIAAAGVRTRPRLGRRIRPVGSTVPADPSAAPPPRHRSGWPTSTRLDRRAHAGSSSTSPPPFEWLATRVTRVESLRDDPAADDFPGLLRPACPRGSHRLRELDALRLDDPALRALAPT